MKLLKIAWIGAFAVAVLAYPVGSWMTSTAVEVWMITPHSPSVVGMNQDLFELDGVDPKDPSFERKVIDIYGNPVSEPIRVLFVPREKLVHPKEFPSLTLLPVDKAKGENPLQAATVSFLAKWTAAGASAAGILLLGLWFVLSRRTKISAPAPSDHPEGR